jgi:hypothetical protein
VGALAPDENKETGGETFLFLALHALAGLAFFMLGLV